MYPVDHHVRSALVRANPELGAKEVAIVAGVGAVLSLVGERVATPLVLGAGLYALGYVARDRNWLAPLLKY